MEDGTRSSGIIMAEGAGQWEVDPLKEDRTGSGRK